MPVYQTKHKTQLRQGYDTYNLIEGQLIATNEPVLVNFLKTHPSFKEVQDETLIRLAPPLHMIKDALNPYRMRKGDIINELRGYGIAVDPYEFADTLTMRLEVARKMLKRNFVTVLNERGQPIFIDRLKIQPVVSSIDENLKEPEEPNGEFFKVETEEPIKLTPITKPKQKKEQPMAENVAMSIDPIIDENEINDGKDYVEFLNEVSDVEFKRALVEKEIVIKDLLSGKQKEQDVKIDTLEKTIEKLKYARIKQPTRPGKIIVDDFKYLVEMNSSGKFILKEYEGAEEFLVKEKTKWTSIEFNVLDCLLRYHDISMDVFSEERDNTRRWAMIETLQRVKDSKEDQKLFTLEVNLLQRRISEITKLEANYRFRRKNPYKKSLRLLARYGINQIVLGSNIDETKRICRKCFELAKMGLQVPPTEEEMTAKLLKYNREKFVVEINNMYNGTTIEDNSEEDIEEDIEESEEDSDDED